MSVELGIAGGIEPGVAAGTTTAGGVGSSIAAVGDTFGMSVDVAAGAIGDAEERVGDAVGEDVDARVALGIDSAWVQANPTTVRNTR